MKKEISNTEDVLDSRNIIERIEELEADDELDDTDKEELSSLKSLVEELRYGDSPEDGITLIHEDYFEEYAQEFAEDIGAIGKDSQWPVYCIDWKRAARELKMDYSEVDFDGQTYYYR